MVGAGIGIIVIIADDASGIGAFDNYALPALFGALARGGQLIAG